MNNKMTSLQKKANYITQKANEIEVVLVKGVSLSYNPSIPYTPDMDKEFHTHFQAIMMVLKDRGFKIWGLVHPYPGEWNVCR